MSNHMPDDWQGREVGDNPYQPPNAPNNRRTAPVSPSAPPKAALVSEGQFQAQVRRLAEVNGWKVFHPYDSRRSAAGYPDLTLAHPDHGIIFAELKREDGKPTPDQRIWLETLELATQKAPQVAVHLWRPSDWADIVAALNPS